MKWRAVRMKFEKWYDPSNKWLNCRIMTSSVSSTVMSIAQLIRTRRQCQGLKSAEWL